MKVKIGKIVCINNFPILMKWLELLFGSIIVMIGAIAYFIIAIASQLEVKSFNLVMQAANDVVVEGGLR